MFPKMDADKDGSVSSDEFLKFYQDVFTRKDANSDKFLTDGEHPASSLRAMDADKDGKVSPAEWDTLFSRQFKRMDADANGKLAAQGLTLPGHLGSVPTAMESIMRHFEGDMAEGDVFGKVINNTGLFGGSNSSFGFLIYVLPMAVVADAVLVASDIRRARARPGCPGGDSALRRPG